MIFGKNKRAEERIAAAEAKRHADAKAYLDKVRSVEQYFRCSKDLEGIYEQVLREEGNQWLVTGGEPKWEPYQSRYDIPPPRQEPVEEPWHVATSIPELIDEPQGKTLDELFAEDEETDD